MSGLGAVVSITGAGLYYWNQEAVWLSLCGVALALVAAIRFGRFTRGTAGRWSLFARFHLITVGFFLLLAGFCFTVHFTARWFGGELGAYAIVGCAGGSLAILMGTAMLRFVVRWLKDSEVFSISRERLGNSNRQGRAMDPQSPLNE